MKKYQTGGFRAVLALFHSQIGQASLLDEPVSGTAFSKYPFARIVFRRVSLLFVLFSAACLFGLSASAQSSLGASPHQMEPTGFIENKGQLKNQQQQPVPQVKYLLSVEGLNIQLRTNGFSYDTYIEEAKTNTGQKAETLPGAAPCDITRHYHRVDINFIGANPAPRMVDEAPAADYMMFYLEGQDAPTQVHHYGKVTYKDLYPGIDLEFVTNPNDGKPVEYNFIVHPGADPKLIQWKYDGANCAALKDSKIILDLHQGQLAELIPSSFYNENTLAKVEVTYLQKGDVFAFDVPENYDSQQTLVIDPTPDRLWGTYFGGSGNENAKAVTVDANGNVIIAGQADSQTGIATSGAHESTISGVNPPGYIAKFNASGVLQWATYYASGLGNGTTEFRDLTTDASGNIYGVGYSQSAIGISTVGSHQTTIGGSHDAFLVKFNSSGVRQWGTYYGGTSLTYGESVALDNSNNIYLCGFTESTLGIATGGGHQLVKSGLQDGFLAKFDNNGTRLWGTYYGGSGTDEAYSVAVDNSNNVYIAGRSNTPTSGGIATSGAYQEPMRGVLDAFLVKFNGSGVRQWGTYFGGAGEEQFGAVTTDISGNVFLAGTTFSSSFIASAGAHQTTSTGTYDGYLAKFNASGVRQWSTYFGGGALDHIRDVVCDNSGNVYFVGYTLSTTGIATATAFQAMLSGLLTNAYSAKFNTSGVFQWGTYYGNNNAAGIAIDVDNTGNVFIVGQVAPGSSGMGSTGSHQPTASANNEVFLAKLGVLPPEICTNGIDDDGDGLVDCADPDCQNLNILQNGQMYRASGVSNGSPAAPDGWLPGTGTPDVNNPSLNSPYGSGQYRVATWNAGYGNASNYCGLVTGFSVSIAGFGGNESISQTNINTIAGQTYDIHIRWANPGVPGSADPARLVLGFLGQGGAVYSSTRSNGATWYDETLTFTATTTASNATFYLTAESTVSLSYVEVDYIVIVPTGTYFSSSTPDVNYDCMVDCPAIVPEICTNGIDDDGDGLVDCADPDCSSPNSCGTTSIITTDGTPETVGPITVSAVSSTPLIFDNQLYNGNTKNFTHNPGRSATLSFSPAVKEVTLDLTNTPFTHQGTTIYDVLRVRINGSSYNLSNAVITTDMTGFSPQPNVTFGEYTITPAGDLTSRYPYLFSDIGSSWAGKVKITNGGVPISQITIEWDGTTNNASGYGFDVLIPNCPSACLELCTNGTDDDGDGLVDCADGDCSISSTDNNNTATIGASAANICAPATATLTASPNAAGLTYAWSGGTPTNAVATTASAAGTYTVTVTRTSTGCTATASQVITGTGCCTAPTAVTATVTQPTCATSTGTILVNATGATEYSINNGTTWQASNTFSGLTVAGSPYVVLARNAVGCQTTASNSPVTLTAATGCCIPPVANAPTVTQPTCLLATGTIVVNATGANEYSVNNGATWQASNSFAGLAVGSYTLKARNAVGCEVSIPSNPVQLILPSCLNCTSAGTVIKN